MQKIPYKIEYQPEKDNMIADALLRKGLRSDEVEFRLILITLLKTQQDAIQERHSTKKTEHISTQEVLQRLERDDIQ